MFAVGDKVVYGVNGVCTVQEIGPMDFGNGPRDYYTLQPCFSKERKIFTPTDNRKVLIRPIITKNQATRLINSIPKLEILGVMNEKNREEAYKEAFQTSDCGQMVRIIKTIWLRKKDREEQGKKTTAQDERYYHLAEDRLYSELAVVLDMNRDEVKEYVETKVQKIKGA